MGWTRILHPFARYKNILKPFELRSLRCHPRNCYKTAEHSGLHAGKVAVLTASTQGIGLGIARRLAQEGAHVILSSRNQENVDRALEDLKKENLAASGIVCDAGKKEDRNRLVELALDKHGGIDYLFSNAAYELLPKNVLDTTEEEWDKTCGALLSCSGGAIVLTSSVVSYTSEPVIGAYCVSKTAINGLTKVLSQALSPMNIRLNALAPGLFRTGFSHAFWENEESLKMFMLSHGIQRLGEPEECAGMVSFLFSRDASYITGEVFVVGGGYTTRL